MSYQIVQVNGVDRQKVIRFDYKTNAIDYAKREAEQWAYGGAYEVVNEKTGLLMGTARRPTPGTAVEYVATIKPVRRDIL